MRLVMTSDKRLIKSGSKTVYRGESNAESIDIFVPKQLGGIDMTALAPVMRFSTPDGICRSIYLESAEDISLKNREDEYSAYNVAIDSEFTEFPGDVIVWLQFESDNSAVVIKSASTKIKVYAHDGGECIVHNA